LVHRLVSKHRSKVRYRFRAFYESGRVNVVYRIHSITAANNRHDRRTYIVSRVLRSIKMFVSFDEWNFEAAFSSFNSRSTATYSRVIFRTFRYRRSTQLANQPNSRTKYGDCSTGARSFRAYRSRDNCDNRYISVDSLPSAVRRTTLRRRYNVYVGLIEYSRASKRPIIQFG